VPPTWPMRLNRTRWRSADIAAGASGDEDDRDRRDDDVKKKTLQFFRRPESDSLLPYSTVVKGRARGTVPHNPGAGVALRVFGCGRDGRVDAHVVNGP
jgi:hypothetical protein